MDLTVLAAQLGGLRATIGALQAQVDAMVAVVDAALTAQMPQGPPPCAHEDADFIGTLGAPRHRCRVCRVEFVPADEAEAAAGVAGD